MKNLVLLKGIECRGIVDVDTVYEEVKVESYEDLVKYVKENVLEDYEGWVDYMKEFLCVDSEEEIFDEIKGGDFNDKVFSMLLGEEEDLVCIEEEYFKELEKERSLEEMFCDLLG